VVATRRSPPALTDWRAQTRFLIAAAALSALVIAITLFPDHPADHRQAAKFAGALESEKHGRHRVTT